MHLKSNYSVIETALKMNQSKSSSSSLKSQKGKQAYIGVRFLHVKNYFFHDEKYISWKLL
jgi:hypothetical protein